MGPGQYPQYTRSLFARKAVGSSLHRDHRTTATNDEPTVSRTLKSRMWLQTHGQQEPDPHPEVVPGPPEFVCTASHDVNESVAYFEEHPELKFDCNNKRAVDSAFKES